MMDSHRTRKRTLERSLIRGREQDNQFVNMDHPQNWRLRQNVKKSIGLRTRSLDRELIGVRVRDGFWFESVKRHRRQLLILADRAV